MMGFERASLHSAVGLEPEFSGVHTVDESVNTKQNLRLRTIRVDTLGNSNQANAGKRQALVEVQRIGQFAGES